MYLRQFISDYVCIDLETTGFSKEFDEVIEVSLCRVRNNKIVDTYTTLTCPRNTRYDEMSNKICYIPSFITLLTGIDDSMVFNKPSIDQLSLEIKEFISDDVILGHNTKFDIGFLSSALNYEFLNNHMDTLGLSKTIVKDIENHKLTTLCEFFGINRNHHRSLDDVHSTIDLYNNLKEFAFINNIQLNKISKRKTNFNQSNLKPNLKLDEIKENIFFNKTISFSGTLSRFSRKEAMQIVINNGGIVNNTITNKTSYLILGTNSRLTSLKPSTSIKHQAAINLIAQGCPIIIIQEFDFYSIIAELNN